MSTRAIRKTGPEENLVIAHDLNDETLMETALKRYGKKGQGR